MTPKQSTFYLLILKLLIMSALLFDIISPRPANARRVVHHKRDLNTVTIKSRTLVFRGWDLLLMSALYVYEQLQAYHPEFISVDRVGKQTFVTFATREDAEHVMWLEVTTYAGIGERFTAAQAVGKRYLANSMAVSDLEGSLFKIPPLLLVAVSLSVSLDSLQKTIRIGELQNCVTDFQRSAQMTWLLWLSLGCRSWTPRDGSNFKIAELSYEILKETWLTNIVGAQSMRFIIIP
ncbi:hypothetical protein MIR68_002349 [Amoeboaphelidium protococcarum]|nr:hypothetical protein MIR68_002349 [Amoeboaphelidium protococcarum]